MSITKYKILMSVVELGSLTKAAEVLGFTQSGVSHAINSLEAEFGFLLLNRSRSGVKLTINGEQVLPTIREILKWHEHLEQEVAAIHGIETGTIHIGTVTSVAVQLLPAMIKQFQQQYPGIEFNLTEGNCHQLEAWIAEGVIDCGFLTLPSADSIEVVPLRQDPFCIILPAGHPLCRYPALTLAQVQAEPFIMHNREADRDGYRVLDQCPNPPAVKYTVGQDYAIMAMVEQGLGISLLPDLVLQDSRNRHFEIRPLAEPQFRILGIGVHSMRHLSPAARRFLSFVKEWSGVYDRKAAN